MPRFITNGLVTLLALTSVAMAEPTPAIAEIKAFSLGPDGKITPYTQDSVADTVVLGIKVTGAPTFKKVPLTYTATVDLHAAYAEAGRKAPPPRKVKFTRNVTLQSADQWVYLMIDFGCYQASSIQFGKLKKATPDDMMPGSCPF